MVRRGCLLGAAILAVAGLAACTASGGTGRPQAAPTSARSSSPAPAPTGFDAAVSSVVNPSTRTGGTLRLVAHSDCDSWDPARVAQPWCVNLQRLISRTLVGYATVDGTRFRLAPDLATSLGRHNAADTVWTYTLQPGLTFSDGRPIRALDVKYDIERLFTTWDTPSQVYEPSMTARYLIDSIAHPRSYRGPYRSGDLTTITTTSNSITFRLASPDPDFDYLMALPITAPVPYRVEGGPGLRGVNYTKHPVASGPFEIGSYRPGKSIVLVRNPHWSQRTDAIRHPLVDAVRLQIVAKPSDLDRRLRTGRADAEADVGVPATFLTSPQLREHADDPVADATYYLAVLPSAVPNVHCRLAIADALDKTAAVRSFGGSTSAVAAGSLTPPGIPGYDASPAALPSGSVAKAKAQLRACGKPRGFTVSLVYPTPSTSGPKLFVAEKRALARVGIRLTAFTPSTTAYGVSGDRSYFARFHVGLVLARWSAPFPTGFGFYHHVDLGHYYLPSFDADVRTLHDPTVDRVLAAAAHGTATGSAWRALDRAVLASATYLPLAYDRTLLYRNPRLTNVTCDNALAFGIYDFVNVGVR